MEEDELGYAPELWKKISDMGWMGRILPKKYGGSGAKFTELVLLLEEMGKFLVPGPIIDTIVAGLAITEFGSQAQKADLIRQIAEGRVKFSIGLFDSPGVRLDYNSTTTVAQPCAGGFHISGHKICVPDLRASDKLLCQAQTPEGISVFMIASDSRGIRAETLSTIALDKRSDVLLEKVKVSEKDLLGRVGQGSEIVDRIQKWSACALSAYAVGAAQKSLDMALEYAKQREQFGGPISSFQVIQHRLVDMLVAIEGARLLTYDAASRISHAEQSDFAIAAAKMWAGDCLHKVVNDAMRIFGGIGSTRECDIQLYFRRAGPLKMFLGNAQWCEGKIAGAMRKSRSV
jgi:alkylation response protein AidB-like acyl-CoA dehydrogenase